MMFLYCFLFAQFGLAAIHYHAAPCNSMSFSCKSYFSGKGVIFDKKVTSAILSPKDHTVSIGEKEAKFADSLMLASVGTREFKKNVKIYYGCDRQYIGFVNELGKRIIFINLVDRRKAKRFLENYNQALACDIIFVLTEPGKEFLKRYNVNVDDKRVDVY